MCTVTGTGLGGGGGGDEGGPVPPAVVHAIRLRILDILGYVMDVRLDYRLSDALVAYRRSRSSNPSDNDGSRPRPEGEPGAAPRPTSLPWECVQNAMDARERVCVSSRVCVCAWG
jgi:hypothetical protein